MRHCLGFPWVLLLVGGCGDPDGILRVKIQGDITEPSGATFEVKGSGRPTSNKLEYYPTFDVDFSKTDSGSKWSVWLDAEHGGYGTFSSGEVVTMGDQRLLEDSAWTGDGWTVDEIEPYTASSDKGKLQLSYITDRAAPETDLEYTLSYLLEVEEADDSGFEGHVRARFENGAILDADIVAKGARPPGSGGGGDDDVFGGSYSMSCQDGGVCVYYSFDSETDYNSFVDQCGPLYLGDGNLCDTSWAYCDHSSGGRSSRTYVDGYSQSELDPICAQYQP